MGCKQNADTNKVAPRFVGKGQQRGTTEAIHGREVKVRGSHKQDTRLLRKRSDVTFPNASALEARCTQTRKALFLRWADSASDTPYAGSNDRS